MISFYQAMSWLASAVGVTAFMAAWSNFLHMLRNPDPKKPLDTPLKELSDWVRKLNSWRLFWFNAAVSFGVPVLAVIVIQFVPVNVFESLETYWVALATIAFAFWQQQRQHASRPQIEEQPKG